MKKKIQKNCLTLLHDFAPFISLVVFTDDDYWTSVAKNIGIEDVQKPK